MFEVGKRYTNPRTKDMATVLYADDYGAYLHWEQEGRRFHMSQTDFKTGGYKEHKEPRTITRWVNVYDAGDELDIGYLSYKTKEEAISKASKTTIIDTIPITYTEPHTEA